MIFQVSYCCQLCSCTCTLLTMYIRLIPMFLDKLYIEDHYFLSVVMVLGAGRGPLVQATLNAAKRTERIVKVYAIEKNPGAVVT